METVGTSGHMMSLAFMVQNLSELYGDLFRGNPCYPDDLVPRGFTREDRDVPAVNFEKSGKEVDALLIGRAVYRRRREADFYRTVSDAGHAAP
jgi:hypothetical protein